MNTSLAGSQLGKYQIVAEIGRGGMGVVYKGYDPALDRHVAIKVLAPHLVWEKGFVERFLREARAAARLKHPNIVTIYDVGQEGGWYYYVMEYVEGRTLTDVIRQRGALSPAETLAILRPLADALDTAHHSGLVHRDIKPGNILIDQVGRVTLTDFGIVRAAQETRLTSTGATLGTPEYMSPEQVQGLAVDPRSDQYSLAVVAYEMLGGQAPFQADSTLVLLYKVVHEALPPLRRLRPELPPRVEEVLARALAKEPGDRYPTVSAFVEALNEALADQKAGEMPAQPAAPPPEPPTVAWLPATPAAPPAAIPEQAPVGATPAVARRRGKGWLWAVVCLLAIAGLIGWGVWQQQVQQAQAVAALRATSYALAEANAATAQAAQATATAIVHAIATDKARAQVTATAQAQATATAQAKQATATTQAKQATATAQAQATATARAQATPKPRKRSKDSMVMVYVPAGKFIMGSLPGQGNDDEHPQHKVYLDAFWIDKTEVTNAQYQRCVADGACRVADMPSYDPQGKPNHPVVEVTWNDARIYCQWAGARLPTEAEWEKAARGTNSRFYPWGNSFDGSKLNFCDRNCEFSARKDAKANDGYARTAPVGSYPAGASPYGALDMAGNVWEWVSDWYDANYYARSPDRNPAGPNSGQYRVLRGGSWYDGSYWARSANRNCNRPDIRRNNFGFRCAVTAMSPP